MALLNNEVAFVQGMKQRLVLEKNMLQSCLDSSFFWDYFTREYLKIDIETLGIQIASIDLLLDSDD